MSQNLVEANISEFYKDVVFGEEMRKQVHAGKSLLFLTTTGESISYFKLKSDFYARVVIVAW